MRCALLRIARRSGASASKRLICAALPIEQHTPSEIVVRMTLAEFIQANLEAILVEWESFARTIVPVTQGMSTEKLRDHAREMLTAIAIDMQTSQSSGQQQAKV